MKECDPPQDTSTKSAHTSEVAANKDVPGQQQPSDRAYPNDGGFGDVASETVVTATTTENYDVPETKQDTSIKPEHTPEVAENKDDPLPLQHEPCDVPETEQPPGLSISENDVAIARNAAADAAAEARNSAEAIRTSATNEAAVAAAKQVADAAEAAAFRWADSAPNTYSGDVTVAAKAVAVAARNAATTSKIAATTTATEAASAISGAVDKVAISAEAAAFRIIFARNRGPASAASASTPSVVIEHADNSSTHENQPSAARQQGKTGRSCPVACLLSSDQTIAFCFF